jgi:hypothetical protein
MHTPQPRWLGLLSPTLPAVTEACFHVPNVTQEGRNVSLRFATRSMCSESDSMRSSTAGWEQYEGVAQHTRAPLTERTEVVVPSFSRWQETRCSEHKQGFRHLRGIGTRILYAGW